ncbi:hypothetical protein Tco_1492634 [Tanacetum coccineum]
MDLPPRDQRHQYLRYEGLQYTDVDILDFKTRLARIYQREVHMVQVSDIGGLPDLMVKGLSARMLMEHRDAHGLGGARRRLSWRQFIIALRLHTAEEMEIVGLSAYWAKSARQIPNKGDLRDYWIEISSARDFLGITPSYTSIRDPILRPCHRSIACSIAQRSQAHKKGLTVIVRELSIIDMGKLVRLLICEEIDNTWAWVALGPERQPNAAAGAHGVAQDAPVVDEGDRAILAPVHAPLPSPVSARTMPKRMARLEEDVHEIRGALAEQREVIGAMASDFSRFTIWAASGIA